MSRQRQLLRNACSVAAAALGIAAAVALLVQGLGLAAAVRHALGFTFSGVPRTHSAAIDIAAHNGAIAAAPLLAARAHLRMGRWGRHGTAAVLALVGVANAAAIGIALGAYGTRALRSLMPHGPLELAAFSIAGGAYMQACRRELEIRMWRGAVYATALLVVVAGIAEVFMTSARGGG